MEDYAPRSPDLSGLITQTSQHDSQNQPYSYPPPPARNDSFSLGSSSYYQPPPLPYHDSSAAYSHSSYEPPSLVPKLESHDSWQPDQPATPLARRPGRPKREPMQEGQIPRSDSTPKTPAGKDRKPSMKSQRPPQPEPEPRPPAPGDAEGIVVRTKFPAARIKRIVQADEEVGKVAQAAPVAVGKALELFMIHLSLAAITEVRARGSKRLLAQHVKTAITKDDTFDFLTDIGTKIPEGAATKVEGQERKVKPERGSSVDQDMDEEFDDDAPKSTRKRRKRKPADDD